VPPARQQAVRHPPLRPNHQLGGRSPRCRLGEPHQSLPGLSRSAGGLAHEVHGIASAHGDEQEHPLASVYCFELEQLCDPCLILRKLVASDSQVISGSSTS
jgi:hypothetical protein